MLEIGPGTGNLTTKLLEVAKKAIYLVSAFGQSKHLLSGDSGGNRSTYGFRITKESSNRVCLCYFTSSNYNVLSSPGGHKLQLIVGDFMKVDLPYFDVCVANVPYQVCTKICK